MIRVLLIITLCLPAAATYAKGIITYEQTPGAFPIVSSRGATAIYVADNEEALVRLSATFLQHDIEMVTGRKPLIVNKLVPAENLIVIGTVERSAFIRQQGKEVVSHLKNKWEAYYIGLTNKPLPRVRRCLIIAGSDRRGTAYGVFSLTQQMGVSPWYWWADVPVSQHPYVYFNGKDTTDYPLVKYRGIFINDEAPALSGWSKEKFGGFNHLFYEKVFELILRLKGNYLWPAMWGSAFYDDDSLNISTADTYGIVIGTSHHEPLMRAHDEWRRYGSGKWNYDSNAARLQAFWKNGMQRATNEKIVSIGMRGDGDEPMSEETATNLLERIVADQRRIIEQTTGKPAALTPQLWALYKEVQDYYDKGMRVPDDVTLLLCDDNWGNVRRLPPAGTKKRAGGYGMYYHFDYVGGPRNYKWINTNQVERVWEQMHLTYRYGVDRIWIVNVGDIKPMELPTQFFLDYAWNPERISAGNLPGYYTKWAKQQFGDSFAKATGEILAAYTKYNSRRKPELLNADTYTNAYNEAFNVVEDYKRLATRAAGIYTQLPERYKDAYYQLVLHPVQAAANLHHFYFAVAGNRHYAKLNDALANDFAAKAVELYNRDSAITRYYNDTLAGGKWHHMMDQTHIGYTYWQQPEKNKLPDLQYVTSPSTKSSQNSPAIYTPLYARSPGKQWKFSPVNGYVAMEAAHFTRAVAKKPFRWQIVPNLGRTFSSVILLPVEHKLPGAGTSSPHLEYNFTLYQESHCKIQLYFSPTLDFSGNGMNYLVGIDKQAPVKVNLHSNHTTDWNKWVADNIIVNVVEPGLLQAGEHTLTFTPLSPGFVIQKIVVDTGGLQPSYLGPPETIFEK